MAKKQTVVTKLFGTSEFRMIHIFSNQGRIREAAQ